MTQDEIIEMARKAGFTIDDECYIRFAKLVAAKEREACVKAVATVLAGKTGRYEAIRTIRARGEE